jgi:DNA (cytosine-5)-methyltransferase 1
MDVVSLFTGAGGMDKGFEYAGFNIIVAVESNPIAAKTYRSNNPLVHLIEGDIREVVPDLKAYEGTPLVIGGPPCQGYSLAGAMDLSDPRSSLIFSFCDAIDVIKPEAFVMENVDNLAKHDKFKIIREQLFERFNCSGYDFKVHIVDSQRFGVAQKRKRMFIAGCKSKTPFSGHHLISYEKQPVTVRQVISHLGRPGSSTNLYPANAKIVPVGKPQLRRTPFSGMLFNGQGRPINLDGLAGTLPASMGGNRTPIIDQRWLNDPSMPPWVQTYYDLIKQGRTPTDIMIPDFMRRLTATEAAHIQTFPSDYAFAGTVPQMFSQIGNAVPCNMAKAVAEGVRDYML